MPENKSARTPRRGKKRRSALRAPLSFLFICAVMFFGMSVFFRVSVIEVRGASSYTDEEIIEASGLEPGDNLFFINRFTAVSSIFSKLPYIEKASIERQLPNRILIEVSESSVLAYAAFDGEYWLLDKNCKVLGAGGYAEAQGLISILGVTPLAPVVGEPLGVEAADSPKVEYAAAILGELSARSMQGDVSWVDVSNVGSPSFDYLGRFTVRLGSNENLRYKFDLLGKAVEQLKAGDAGTIDLSGDRQAQFMPE